MRSSCMWFIQTGKTCWSLAFLFTSLFIFKKILPQSAVEVKRQSAVLVLHLKQNCRETLYGGRTQQTSFLTLSSCTSSGERQTSAGDIKLREYLSRNRKQLEMLKRIHEIMTCRRTAKRSAGENEENVRLQPDLYPRMHGVQRRRKVTHKSGSAEFWIVIG